MLVYVPLGIGTQHWGWKEGERTSGLRSYVGKFKSRKILTRAKLQEAYLAYLGETKVEVLFGNLFPLDIVCLMKVIHQL